MCGIFGVWHREGGRVDVERLQSAVGSMRHRGPDDEGYLLVDTRSGRAVECGGDDTAHGLNLPHVSTLAGEEFDLALGHRRLAILDTSVAGHQPMLGERCAIVHSGEIYNFEDLRHGLQTRWRSRSDTETFLAAFEAFGPAPLDLDGMWGTAIWDPEARRLYCTRDRLGMKPFYYSEASGTFVFSSEIKGILAYLRKEAHADPLAVRDYLAWGMTDHREGTFVEGVKALGPGRALWVEKDRTRETGGPAARDRLSGPDASVRELLADSVSRRLLSDVPVATCLSGGIDSSSVLALAAGARRASAGEAPDSFTAVFDDPKIDERRFAMLAAGAAGSTWHEVRPSSDDLFAHLGDLSRVQEAPTISSSSFAQWELMRQARAAGVRVLLDGQGGDELFAGYPQHLDRSLRMALRHVRLGRFRSLSQHAGGWVAATRRALRDPRTSVPSWVSSDLAAKADPQSWRYPRDATLGQMLEVDLRYRLPALLRYEERSSMAHGVEARLPFLDDRLIELAGHLPDEAKIGRIGQKAVLRNAMREVVPTEIIERRDKIGFATPQRDWLLAERSRVREIVADNLLLGSGFVEPEAVRKMLDAPDPEADTDAWWRVMSLAVWLDGFTGETRPL